MTELEENQTNKIKHKLELCDQYEFVGTQAFKVTRENQVFKLFHEPHENGSTGVLSRLIQSGIEIPKLWKCDRDEQGIYKYYEWWDGRTFEDLIRSKEIKPEHYEKLGVFLARVNSIENEEMFCHAGFINYLPKNIVLRNDGHVFVCDHNKLVWSPFPENAIVRYILTEDLTDSKEFTFELRAAFLKGYRSVKNLSLYSVLVKQSQMIYGDTNVYIRPHSFKENPKYKAVKKGKQVLSLKFHKGQRSFEAMYQGAEYSYACDILHSRWGNELFKSSDYGKLIAYTHEFDGRDLHYKWIELNSPHFIQHLESSYRKWDLIYLDNIFDILSIENKQKLEEYLNKCKAEIMP